MSRFDITLGLLASIGVVVVTALIGFGENERMRHATIGFEKRSVESGAMMFDQYCASCHGPNASGLNCPPLDQTSGLHGGAGVACRLEELGWSPADPYGYIFSVISTGRQYSTRPEQFPGNRMTATPLPPGAPRPEATSPPVMAMPAWGQAYGGPLRDDQIRDIANYLVAFRESLPTEVPAARAIACAKIEAAREAALATPTTEPTETPVGGEGTSVDDGTPGTPIVSEEGGLEPTITPAAEGTGGAGSRATATVRPTATP
jgi:mono/diheme cytochrome c family protein